MARDSKSSEHLTLAEGFPQASDEAWQALVRRILHGADIDDALARRTYDDIAIKPLYTARDLPGGPDGAGLPGMAPFTRGHRVTGPEGGGWDIRQLHWHPDPDVCNRAILDDLSRGVTSIALRLDRTARMGRDPSTAAAANADGVMVVSIDDLDAVLAGVHLDACPVGLRSGAAFMAVSAILLSLLKRRGVAPDAFAGNLNADPLGALAELGALTTSPADALEQLGELARHVSEAYPAATAACVDASGYHDAGASEAQELACAMATGVAYLRAMTGAGLDTNAAFGQVAFTFAADANLFLTVAKLRAARRLWGRIAEACGAPDALRRMRLHVVTSSRMLARRDPWVNILRGTVAALAGAVAGADSITVLPYTAAIGLPEEGARRIARNTQLVLQQESSLGRVIDPAGGSWAIESLTDAMAGEAWALFQEIEREGGMAASLLGGHVQQRIASIAARRAARAATLADPLTGTSAFPWLAEPPVAVQQVDFAKLRSRASAKARKPQPSLDDLASAPKEALFRLAAEGAAAGATIGALSNATARGDPAPAESLPRRRLGEAFEALRDLSDSHLEKTGRRPTVLIVRLGTPAQYMAAESYARNFLAAGGIDAVSVDASGGTPEKALRESGATVAVLCSDVAGYRASGASLASELAGNGARAVYAVGTPGAGEDALGGRVSRYLHDGCDLLAELSGILRIMGILKT